MLPKDNPPRTQVWDRGTIGLRLLTELMMFEKVTVTDAIQRHGQTEAPAKERPHQRELVVAIIILPKTQKPTFTCRRKGHCSHGQPWTSLTSSHPYSHPGSQYLLGSQATTAWGS